MTNETSNGRYRAQHRAPNSSSIPGRLPIAGGLAVLVVAGGTFAVSCTATGQQEKASWQQSSTSVDAAATAAPAAQVVSALTNDELAKVARVSWSLDGRLLAVHDKGTPLRSLGDLTKIGAGPHTLTAVVELEDGRVLTIKAPFSSSASSSSSNDPSVDARAERSSQRQELAKQAAQERQRAQQQARVAAAAKQRAAQADQAAPAKSVANAKPAQAKPAEATPAVQAKPAVQATPAVQPTAASKPATTKPATAKPAATKPPAPAPTAAKQTAPAPKQTASAPTVAPAQSGSFDPVKFDWSSVGGPTKATGGNIVLGTAGASLSNCNIGSLRANADGQKVSNCTINNGVFGPGGYTITNSFITSNSDGMDPTGTAPKVIKNNKIWRDGTRVGTKHQDGIQFWQGGNALIQNNWIGGFQTSAIMVKADLGPISNVTIDSNFLHNPTGYFQLYLCNAGHGLKNITVTNNAFGKANFTASTCGANLTFVHTEAQRQAAIKAGNAGAASWIVWNNNYVAGTHAVVAPPGGWDK